MNFGGLLPGIFGKDDSFRMGLVPAALDYNRPGGGKSGPLGTPAPVVNPPSTYQPRARPTLPSGELVGQILAAAGRPVPAAPPPSVGAPPQAPQAPTAPMPPAPPVTQTPQAGGNKGGIAGGAYQAFADARRRGMNGG